MGQTKTKDIAEEKGLIYDYEHMIKSGAYFYGSKLPRLNGVSIESIHAPCYLSSDMAMLDTCHWGFTAENTFTDTSDINRMGVLPQEFKDLLGWQTINGQKYFVQSVWFRTSKSGHASEDSLMSISVAEKTGSISIWRDKGKPHWTGGLTHMEPYVQKWLQLFDTDIEVSYPKYPNRVNVDWEPRFPKIKSEHGTMFEYVDGVTYPTMFSLHWIPFGHLPFVSLTVGESGWPNNKKIRVYDKVTNRHLFFEKVEGEDINKGDTGLMKVSFNRDNPFYAHIVRWRDNKDIVTYTVKTVHRDGTATVEDDRGGRGSKERNWKGIYYRLTHFRDIPHPEPKVPEAGQRINVYLPKFKSEYEFIVLDTDVKDDCRGTIKLQKVMDDSRNKEYNYERWEHKEGDEPQISIVEKQWFDELLTGRRITVL